MIPELADNPVNRSQEDELDRVAFAELISKAVSQFSTTSSYVFGLCGPYGSGKSSVVNIVEETLPENVKVVRFAPWAIRGRDEMIAELYDCFQRELIPAQHRKVARRVAGSALDISLVASCAFLAAIASDKQQIPKLIQWAPPIVAAAKEVIAPISLKLKKPKAVEVSKVNFLISDWLSKQNQKLLVVIDDVDRLPKNEIEVVIQLCKCIASYTNVNYLLVFDYSQVVWSLRDIAHDPEGYLEKIVTRLFHLPEFSPNQRSAYLDKLLSSLNLTEGIDKVAMERASRVFQSVLLPGLSTPRAMKKYALGIRDIAPNYYWGGVLHGDLADLLLVEYIRQFVPSVYGYLQSADSPTIGGEVRRLSQANEVQEERIAERSAILSELSPTSRRLATEALKLLDESRFESDDLKQFRERRFSSRYWRRVYLGFDYRKARANEESWQTLRAELASCQKKLTVLQTWDSQERRHEWILFLSSKLGELNESDGKWFLERVFAWGDSRGQEPAGFFGMWKSWEHSVIHCVELLFCSCLSKCAFSKTVIESAENAGAIIGPGFLCAFCNPVNDEGVGKWYPQNEAAGLRQHFLTKFRSLLDSGEFWKVADPSVAVSAWRYLIGKEEFDIWFNNLMGNPLELSRYVNRVLGESADRGGSFGRKDWDQAILNLEPSLLTEAGNRARLRIVEHPMFLGESFGQSEGSLSTIHADLQS